MVRKFFFWLPLALLLSCAGGQLAKRNHFRNLLAQGQYEEALKSLAAMDIAKNAKSKLLFHVEKGMIHFSAQEYYQSLKSFELAKKIVDDLFATQVGSKILTAVTNDSFDVYYGQSYEKSLIHFYLALNHFLLYQQGKFEAHTYYPSPEEVKENPHAAPAPVAEKILSDKERSDELGRARAEILAWDSTLKTLRNDKEGKSVFKDDLMAKMFGAFIHEAQDRRSDDQIALQLYKDAKKIIFRNYNSYATFNMNSVKFKKDFSKLPELSEAQVKSEYVSSTPLAQELSEYLDEKILQITKKVAPSELKKEAKLLGASDELVQKVKNTKGEHNLTVLLEVGMIPDKVADHYNIGLEGALNQSKDSKTASTIARFGAAAIAAFAAYELGLMAPVGPRSMPGSSLGVEVAQVAVENTAIAFELPKINNYPLRTQVLLEVKNKEGMIVAQKIAPVVNPMGDIAEESLAEDSAARYLKVGMRVALKHASAIAAAYVTYTVINSNGKQAMLAKTLAVLEYVAAAKIIENSERADTRYWSTLPQNFRLVDFALPKGSYELFATFKNVDSALVEKTAKVGDIEVTSARKQLVRARIF